MSFIHRKIFYIVRASTDRAIRIIEQKTARGRGSLISVTAYIYRHDHGNLLHFAGQWKMWWLLLFVSLLDEGMFIFSSAHMSYWRCHFSGIYFVIDELTETLSIMLGKKNKKKNANHSRESILKSSIHHLDKDLALFKVFSLSQLYYCIRLALA